MALNDDLIKYFQLDKLSSDEQGKFVKEINDLVRQTVMVTILRNLNARDRVEFLKRIKRSSESNDDWQIFAREKIPQLDIFLDREIKNTLQEIKLGI